MDHSTKLDASVGASSARFPKFVRRCSTLFRELRKAKGTSKFMISSAVFDLKFLLRTRSKLCRNFKSAALAPHDFAVRELRPRQKRSLRPPHPALTSVTIAKRPSRRDGTATQYYCFYPAVKNNFGKSEIGPYSFAIVVAPAKAGTQPPHLVGAKAVSHRAKNARPRRDGSRLCGAAYRTMLRIAGRTLRRVRDTGNSGR